MNDKAPIPQLSRSELQLLQIKETLKSAPQDKLYTVRTRFNGLLNAYKGDGEALAMIQLLMAEYTFTKKIEMERKSETRRESATGNATNIH